MAARAVAEMVNVLYTSGQKIALLAGLSTISVCLS